MKNAFTYFLFLVIATVTAAGVLHIASCMSLTVIIGLVLLTLLCYLLEYLDPEGEFVNLRVVAFLTHLITILALFFTESGTKVLERQASTADYQLLIFELILLMGLHHYSSRLLKIMQKKVWTPDNHELNQGKTESHDHSEPNSDIKDM